MFWQKNTLIENNEFKELVLKKISKKFNFPHHSQWTYELLKKNEDKFTNIAEIKNEFEEKDQLKAVDIFLEKIEFLNNAKFEATQNSFIMNSIIKIVQNDEEGIRNYFKELRTLKKLRKLEAPEDMTEENFVNSFLK